MAITHVKKKVGRSGNLGQNGARQYVDVYQVISSSSADDAYIVSSASFGGVSIPQVGDQHPSDPASLVVRVDQKETAASGVKWSWDVTVEYSTSTNGGGGGGGGGGDDPLDMRWQRSWSTTTLSKVRERARRLGYQVGTAFRPEDSEGLIPIANTAGDAFDPPIEEPVYIWVLTIIRNEPLTGFPARAKPYLNAISAVGFYGFGSRQALMANIHSDEKFKGNLTYLEVTYEIHFGSDEHFWDRLLLNHGFRHKEQGETGKVIDLDNSLSRNLDVEGRILGVGADAVFIVFETKEVASFAPLQLEY